CRFRLEHLSCPTKGDIRTDPKRRLLDRTCPHFVQRSCRGAGQSVRYTFVAKDLTCLCPQLIWSTSIERHFELLLPPLATPLHSQPIEQLAWPIYVSSLPRPSSLWCHKSFVFKCRKYSMGLACRDLSDLG